MCHTARAMRVMAVCVSIFCLMGCGAQEGVQNDPVNRQQIVTAAADGLDACQSRMDQLAHADVTMLEHSRQLLAAISSFGYVPSYVCVGTVPFDASAQPPERNIK